MCQLPCLSWLNTPQCVSQPFLPFVTCCKFHPALPALQSFNLRHWSLNIQAHRTCPPLKQNATLDFPSFDLRLNSLMYRFRVLLVPAFFGLILLTIALVTRSGKFARENPGNPINSAMREAMNMMILNPIDEAAINLRYPTAKITSSGLRYVITTPSKDTIKPERGQSVVVNYRSTFMDGKELDNSYKRGKPLDFQVGLARVIPGWDEGVHDMTVGEKRTLIIPYWLGYGEKGIQGHIPEKATLIFEVELLEIR